MVGWRHLLIAASSLLAASCGAVALQPLKPGELSGRLFVMWVGENTTGFGDGLFVFVPDHNQPLTFTYQRADGAKRTIRPGMMYTDGGSIPRVVQVLKGFSPWGYAPAYMVHDWLFYAHGCIRAGKDGPQFDSVRDVTFNESAEILGDAIETLIAAGQVEPKDFAPEAITTAVDSSVARGLWDNAPCKPVSAKDAADAAKALPGASSLWKMDIQAFNKSMKLPKDLPKAETTARSAVKVYEMSFGPSK